MVNKIIMDIDTERKKQKITMTALSEKSGVSRKHLSFIFNGKTNPTIEIIDALTKALGMKIYIKD